MKSRISAPALALASSIVCAAAFAAEPAASAEPAAAAEPAAGGAEGLLKKYACLACHSADAKVVGPSYKEVAAKYRDQKDSEQVLIAKVKNGGTGVWGQIPMPPNASVPDADLQTMIKWILALK